MKKAAGEARKRQETLVLALVSAQLRVEHVQLRVRQAIRRDERLGDLLEPAERHLQKVHEEIDEVLACLKSKS